MSIHKHNTISTGYGWIALDGSCIPVSHPNIAMPMLMRETAFMRQMYNTVRTRDTHTYYRFLQAAYDNGYTLVGRHQGFLAVEASSSVILDKHQQLIQQICKDSGLNSNTLMPVKRVYSVVDPVLDPDVRRRYYSENLEPPQGKKNLAAEW